MDAATPAPDRLPVVGMVGGGQLARMSHQAAIALGQSLRVLAASPGDPAALVCADVLIGNPDDLDALRGLARGAEVVTFDHEGVPGEVLRMLVAEGVAVRPGPDALLHAQDKLVMRRALGGVARMPEYVEVADAADVEGLAARTGWPVVLKAVRGGYDGRGVWMLDGPDPGLVAQLLSTGTPLMAEQAVAMRRELAVQVARSPYGQAAAWPVVETVQRDGQCVEVLAPAPDLDPATAAAAQQLALRIAAQLDVTGLLAVELFDTDGTADGLVVNELAMRPHNSGHWTIEGARTSQFEQHLRAVLDYPLGATQPTAPVVVMANVLGARRDPAQPPVAMSVDERIHHLFARFPDVKVHLYGKAERPARKVGHVTVLGDRLDEVRARAVLAAEWLSTGVWADGWSPYDADARATRFPPFASTRGAVSGV
ncbi:5-(carboxyamino)imidazole ribonucleotide synthase [Pseudonocardia charpentierae]|uniref:N5-carboxyaminoimidazole ribonucleotide synthase n=1 Tax=Pseudonocardia charpentierae TaxID=3075545 RepID=A0ABU2N4J9_9PSEU|nr:5-(carboxyamino)imidazole ribonucleotide synthase [Pseudonocardia sp. DSM 45834]MDT0348799.1 5-(carboxyamino)imidazole ribonucleotide synthase [Pseudonocardia sp. DSM 45834]